METEPAQTNKASWRRRATLSLAALGVVFGDIGTSPLYAIRECFHGEYGFAVNQESILGVLSLMFWALAVIVSIKYLTFVFQADNRGEGGVLALTSLLTGRRGSTRISRRVLIALGVFGACLLYGDGMITPAISVMSAAEGLRIITPDFQPYVIPLTLVILAALFLLQHRGTAGVGALFGPIILVWFSVLALLGLRQIIAEPQVLAAISPVYGFKFLLHSGWHGFAVLGAVFLVVTGAEALYADLGHFGRRPIRQVWFYLVLPALLLNYFGQGALLLVHPEEAHHPFYATVPGWAVIPMVFLATAATIIASQAVITGVFSLTRQAIQMGYLPRLHVVQTSPHHVGQIYVPPINWLMMIATLGLVLGFQSSSKLAAAYGVAVTATMLITTLMFYVVARTRWHWNIVAAGIPLVVFLAVDAAFFAANLTKIMHGAWFPLVLGGLIMIVMVTWKRGREILGEQLRGLAISFDELTERLTASNTPRVAGHAVYLSGHARSVPVALPHNLTHNKVLHSNVLFLSFAFREIPRVDDNDRLMIKDLGNGFQRITAHYGFMETPSVRQTLALAAEQGLEVPIADASFFLGREKLVVGTGRLMTWWRARLFAFLSRNGRDASAYFDIPEERVVEIGVRLSL